MLKNKYKNPNNRMTSAGKLVVNFYEKENPEMVDLLYILADALDNKVTKKDFINFGYGNKNDPKL